VSPIQPINLTPRHQQNSSHTSSNTSTGHHSKWSQHAWKSPQQETSQDKSLDIEDPTKDLSFVLREARKQDPTNRQNSIKLSGLTLTEQNLMEQWKWKQQEVIAAAEHAYDWAVNNGIAKEQARAVLPEGLTVSRLYMNGTLRSWVHFIELRSSNGTQLEHQQVAIQCAKVISEIFPMIDGLNNANSNKLG
jgi:thymidylate synthase ThyX